MSSMADESGSEISRKEIKRADGILRYGRDELLGLQEAYVEAQEEWWMQLIKDLGADVAEELHELQAVPDASRFRRRSKNSERRQRSKAKRDALHALSINALENGDGREEYGNCHEDSSDSSWHKVDENFGGHSHARKGSWNNRTFYSEDEPEAESFQPPAFAVEGEPDFESGPPQDGWEYLRRVKYEAARCPKVVVAEIDPTKLISEQTPYMPEVQEIPVCPPDLVPSKEWEEHFLKDFSLLRMALSGLHVPPKSVLDHIPSLRNKAAWEVRCFGSITSMHENSKDLDIVTTEESTSQPGEGESANEARSSSLSSLDSAQNIRDSVASDTRSKPVDIDKDHPVAFVELLETQLSQLFNAGPVEANYVIDLGLLNAQVPLLREREGSFHEAEYLISGELVEAHDVNDVKKWASSSVGIHDPEDDPVTSTELANSYVAEELGHAEDPFNRTTFQFDHLTVGEPEGQLGNIEHAKASSSDLSPDDNKSADLTTPVYMASVGADTHTSGHVEVETEAQAEHLPTMEVEDAAEGIECMESLPSYFDVVDVNDQLTTADFMESLDGCAEHLDQADFQDICTRIDTQFEYLTIGGPEGVQSQMEVMLPSFAYPESPNFEDAHLPNEDFMESLVGLEIYHSGNILQDEPDDESIGAPGHNSEFKIDESLEELFTKVFQLVGVSQLPFIRLLVRLDEVSRAALFRYHVSWLEHVDGLPQDRALWLLALSAVVDTPLDAQTSAAFRAVLRHCAGIRALKQTRDDEDLYMLNVLIAVAGVYFGQAEATVP